MFGNHQMRCALGEALQTASANGLGCLRTARFPAGICLRSYGSKATSSFGFCLQNKPVRWLVEPFLRCLDARIFQMLKERYFKARKQGRAWR